MRLALLEGFDYYRSTLDMMYTRWNSHGQNYNVETFAPGLGGEGQCLSIGSQVTWFMTYSFDPVTKLTCHFALMPTVRNSYWNEFIYFATNLSRQWGLSLDEGGHLQVRGEGGAVLATGHTSLACFLAYRICMSADLDTGHFKLSINGDVEFDLPGVDIQDDPLSNHMDMIVLTRPVGAGYNEFRIDDVIVGLDECVDWGPQEINTMAPTADIAVEWTRSEGANNYANVDEPLYNADTDYNSTAVLNQKDIFEFSDTPHVPQTILGVQLVNIARKEESATRRVKDVVRLGGVDYIGDEHNLAEQYQQCATTWLVNPATGVAFTAAEVNAIRGGYLYSADV